MSTAPHWLTALAITLAMGAYAALAEATPEQPGSATQAAQEDAAAQASRDWAAAQVCAGRPFEWLDDKTLVCHKELP